MGQTLGSQILGSWYDVIGLAVIAAVFFQLAISADTLSVAKKESLPAFVSNKKICFSLGCVMSLMAILKWLELF